MEGDLLLAGVASAILKNAKPTTGPVTTPTGSGPVTAQFSSEQIDQLAGALMQGVGNIQLPPAQVQFPSNLQLSFSDAELARIAGAIAPNAKSDIKSRIYQRSILIDISPTTIPDSTFIFAEFPTGQKVASFNFAQQAGLIGVTLSASIVNTQTKPCGFFSALADTPLLNFDTTPYASTAQVGNPKTPDSQILLSVFTHQNSTPTTVNPNTRSASLSFGLENAVQIVNSQTTLSLYAFQTASVAGVSGTAGQLMSAVLTAYYIPTGDT
ncbi:hypothetical protein EBR66_07605 [bacterium]|nr:hypothetical protein [bacterium]